MIRFFTDGTEFRLPAKKRTADWLRAMVEAEGRRLGSVNFVFCSPERQLETNRAFLGHDWPTDVITFDYTAGEVIGGDIFVDPTEVASNAGRFGQAAEKEMRRVMVHGVLHLCGYGDGTKNEQRTMRAKEDFYLARFYV